MNIPEQRHETAGLQTEPGAESLLFTQYRCWMAGYSTRDISCWEVAWNALAGQTGPDGARELYGAFHGFVRAILQGARREIGWRPAACRCLCRDEALVLALVGASQQGRVADELGRACALLGQPECAPLLAASRSLARSLTNNDLHLQPIRLDEEAAIAAHRLH